MMSHMHAPAIFLLPHTQWDHEFYPSAKNNKRYNKSKERGTLVKCHYMLLMQQKK